MKPSLRDPWHRVRTGILFLGVVLLMIPSGVSAQGNGVVEGRLVNGTDPKIVPGAVELDVVQLGGGMSIIKSSVADASGRFRFEGLPTGSPLMIRANYQSANYHGRINFDPSGKASVDIEVFESTTSMQGIRVESARFGFQSDGEHIRALESVSIVNETRPRRTYMNPEGNFRFSKPEGLDQLPRLSVTGPGAAMPLTQSPLESADGTSYYSLYPVRPGTTTFEVDYVLPYHDRSYTFHRKFYQDIETFQIGVLPHDLNLTGPGLQKVQTDTERNFAVYTGGPVRSGTEVSWNFSGGSVVPLAAPQSQGGGSQIKPFPTAVVRNALVLGPLLLMGLIAFLWYAFNAMEGNPGNPSDSRTREMKERRERLLNYMASLDERSETLGMDRREYIRRREQAKRQLRRIAVLMGKK